MKPSTQRLRITSAAISLLFSAVSYAVTTDVGVAVPFQYGVGLNLFKKSCSQCHGEWAKGTDKGPPLIHDFYKPSHHGDGAFYSAALNGVKAHHWRFGDMPPVAGVRQSEVEKITSYVRWLQQTNGLY